MKKFTQIVFLLVMAVSVAFAQQTKDFNAKITKAVNTPVCEKVLVTSISESFEGTFPPSGWALYSPDGGTGWNQQTVGTTPIPGWNGGVVTPTPNGTGGTKMAFATWSTGGASANDQWLVTPQITVSTNYNLFFYVRKFGAYMDVLDVKVSTTTNQIAAFTQTLGTLTWSATDSGWATQSYSLAAYAGQNIYIAFNEHVDDNFNDGAAVFIDLVQVDVNAGIQNNNQDVAFRLFPNPVRNTMTIETGSNINRVKVSNILGQLVYDEQADGKRTQVNTSDFQPGVYFVVVDTENGLISRKINVTK
ncbi:MAG: choice-of-anchor J domain-containing protein [Bacteroidales bacterium]